MYESHVPFVHNWATTLNWLDFFFSPTIFPCSIISRHKALEGVTQGSVEYQALQLVSSLEHYGVEWHWARDAEGQRLAIGVGPEGIAICKEDFSLVNRYMIADTLFSELFGQHRCLLWPVLLDIMIWTSYCDVLRFYCCFFLPHFILNTFFKHFQMDMEITFCPYWPVLTFFPLCHLAE